MTAERVTVSYTGRVQGVGFRWTARRIAGGFAVTGWVRNEADGSVRLVAEGERAELDRLLAAIREAMARGIQGETVERTEAEGGLDGFEIRR